MIQLSVSEARAKLAEILDRVERGEEITIARHGAPAAVLVRPDAVRIRRAARAIEDGREVAALVSAARNRPLPESAVSAENAEHWVESIRADRER